MNIIVCIDDNGGMLFNGRRQSRDRIVLEDVLTMVEATGAKLWLTSFSEKLLKPYCENRPYIIMDDACLEKAAKQDFCFIEKETLTAWEEKIHQLILYRWNRVYPADTYFDINLDGWQLVSTGEFSGASHETITKEVYEK